MDWKKYIILLVPYLLLGVILFIYLPDTQRPYVFAVPLIFWITYYTWVWIDKKLKQKDRDKII